METATHLQLKRIAVALLLRDGYDAVASEVLAPIARYRADVAGYIDRRPVAPDTNHLAPVPSLFATAGDEDRAPARARTVIIECKASRPDLVRDADDLDALLDERDRLHRARHRYEQRVLRDAEPHLRDSGAFLFRDMERWTFQRSASVEYRKLNERIDGVERRLHGSVKFDRMRRYALADRLFLLTPPGLVRPRELPDGWGLLECARSALRSDDQSIHDLSHSPVKLVRPAADAHAPLRFRRRLLRNIAVAATRQAIR